MKKFIINIFLFIIPFLIIISLFVIIDPYMLFFSNKGKIKIKDEYYIHPNRDFQATELFLKNYKEYHYNSFIFGNSRSYFYDIEIWKKKIKSGNCFHFNSNSESLFGIERKFDFLNKKSVKIKNALIVIDYNLLRNVKNSNSILSIKHPLISGQSYFKFYLKMFEGFFPKPFLAHLQLFLTGKKRNYMEKYGIYDNTTKINLSNNQLIFYKFDSLIRKDKAKFYEKIKNKFYKRETREISYLQIIKDEQKILLKSIKKIIDENQTKYKIIINPLYEQVKLNKKDVDYLKSIFGIKNVFDFSGKNKFTDDYTNYYETSHYRPNVSEEIMNIVYSNNN